MIEKRRSGQMDAFLEDQTKKIEDLKKLRVYLPELFTYSPNSVRTGFMEAEGLLVADFNDPQETRRFQSETWNAEGNNKCFLTYRKAFREKGWELRAILEKDNYHQAKCVWGQASDGLSREVEITLGNWDDEFLVTLDYHGKTLTYSGSKGAVRVALNQGFNEKRFEDDHKKSRFPEWIRLHNAAILDTNLFYLSYEIIGESKEKEVLIVPIQIGKPNT